MATTAILPKGRTACSRGRYAQVKRRKKNNVATNWQNR